MADRFDKKYYRIGDVSAMLDLPQSTLRYWESEFSELSPKRTASGLRIYTPADVEMVEIIRFLLYDKGLTLDGAREHLRKNRRDTMRIHEAVKRLRAVRDRLTAILGALDERQRRQRAALFAAKAAEEAEKNKE